MLTPFFRHWNESGAVPEAWTVKVAWAPAQSVWFWGWSVISGGELTVKVAALLVTLPQTFVTTTS